MPAFISILVFHGLFNQNFGEINLILSSLFGLKPDWFTDPFLAKVMLLIVNTWLGYPYMMLLGMGFLQSVPRTTTRRRRSRARARSGTSSRSRCRRSCRPSCRC